MNSTNQKQYASALFAARQRGMQISGYINVVEQEEAAIEWLRDKGYPVEIVDGWYMVGEKQNIERKMNYDGTTRAAYSDLERALRLLSKAEKSDTIDLVFIFQAGDGVLGIETDDGRKFEIVLKEVI